MHIIVYRGEKGLIELDNEKYHTFSEYMKDGNLSASEEDYIEMIYRLSIENKGNTRVSDLAQALNVKPPSVTKMIKKLADKKLLNYRKYGTIELRKKGVAIGKTLLDRHNSVENFLKILGISNKLLEETEKIEHTLSEDTLKSIKCLVNFLNENKDIMDRFYEYKG